jgi:DNA-binding IclR family transcriptional regulator
MSSLRRMLAVLDLFTPAHPILTADEIMSRLDYSRGTAYRYVRELCATGLLSRIASAYTLGPRIIELDYYIRQCDPMLLASQAMMRQLRDKFDCDVLLTNFFDERVVVSHHERGRDNIIVSYGRGRLMPLFRGPASKAILAHLPTPRLKRLFTKHRDEIAKAGLGASWDEFRKALAAIRRVGHVISFAELDPGNVGIAVPIMQEAPNPPGCLVLVLRDARYAIMNKGLALQVVKDAARHITVRMNQAGQAEWDDVVPLEIQKRTA